MKIPRLPARIPLLLAGLASLMRAESVDPAKSHTLFMGADFAVVIDGKTCPVRNVSGSYWVVEKDGATVQIPTRGRDLQLKVTPALKLTPRFVNLTDYTAIQGYSPQNDPSTRLTKALDNAAAANIGRQTAVTQQEIYVQHQIAVVQASQAESALKTGNAAVYSSEQRSALSDFSNALMEEARAGDELGGEPAAEINSTGHDAVDVTFSASSEREYGDAYVVAVVKYRGHGEKPGTYRNLLYAKEIGDIGPQARLISLNIAGFPSAFELLNFQLHLYNRGEELATSVSSKRVSLTRDEAFDYLKMEYVSSHKGQTMEAAPALAVLPGDFRQAAQSDRYTQDFYVRVSKEGVPEGIFRDASGKAPWSDPTLETIVNRIRFEPALKQGEPVEGMACVNLRRLDS